MRCGTICRSRTCHRRHCGTSGFYGYKHTRRIHNNYRFSTLSVLDGGSIMLRFTYWLQNTRRIRNNYSFSTLSGLDGGAIMLRFTYPNLLFVILAIWWGNMLNAYLCHRSGGLSRGYASSFNYVKFYGPYLKPFYCHPHFVTHFTLLHADTMWSLVCL
jgi:hypothetical protein